MTLEDFVETIIPVKQFSVWKTKKYCTKCKNLCTKTHYVEYNGEISLCCYADIEEVAVKELDNSSWKEVVNKLYNKCIEAGVEL